MSDNKKLLVVIDPGHTGNTYNAGVVKGYYESKAVYDLSLYEKTALENQDTFSNYFYKENGYKATVTCIPIKH